MNDKPVVDANFWRGVGNALVFALILWAAIFIAWLA